MGDKVTLINSGEQAAKAAVKYLNEHDLRGSGGKRRYFVSDRAESFASIAGILLGSDIENDVEMINIDSFGG